MNDQQHLEFENYLREFHPRPPKALPPAHASLDWRRLAAAAALLLSLGTSLWLSSHTPMHVNTKEKIVEEKRGSSPSTIVLTKLALENPSNLDVVLARSPRTTLPRFDRPDGALEILARE